MIIGGIQKSSLIDFPSKISCVLFTAGCNFHCPYCHNPELVSPPFEPLDLESIFEFLSRRRSLLDGVVITGGEPTLHSDLDVFCDRIKHLGFSIKLDTNGSQPERIRSLINTGCIDYIAMDVKTLPENYSPHLARISPEPLYQSIRLIKTSGIRHEFRTTCAPPFVDAEIILKIARLIEGADLFVLQTANIDKSILKPDFFIPYDQAFKKYSDLVHFQQTAAPYLKSIQLR